MNKQTQTDAIDVIYAVADAIDVFESNLRKKLGQEDIDIREPGKIESMVILKDEKGTISKNWLYNQWGPEVLEDDNLQELCLELEVDLAHLLGDRQLHEVRSIKIFARDAETKELLDEQSFEVLPV